VEAGQAGGAGILETPFQVVVEMDHQQFVNRCGAALSYAHMADKHMQQVLAAIAGGYKQAWTNHIRVLSHQSEFERILSGFILGAAMGFLPGLLSAGLSPPHFKMIDVAAGGEWIIPKFKMLETLGLSAQKTFGHLAFSQMLHPNKKPKAGSATDPDAFEANGTALLNSQMERAFALLLSWQERAGQPGFHMAFDPLEVMKEALTVNGEEMSAASIPDAAAVARGFEMGMWDSWLDRYGAKLVSMGTKTSPPVANTEEAILGAPHVYGWAAAAPGDVTDAIIDRCNELGISNAHIRAAMARAHHRVSEQAQGINQKIGDMIARGRVRM